MEIDFLKEAKALYRGMKKDRRYLHENAEVGFHLPKTSRYVFNRLTAMGYNVKPIGRCALIAEIGRKEKPCLLLRADMDALPMREDSGLEFACKDGNMHACGHDLHAAMLLGCAMLLKKYEARLKGRVRLLFQPAEETLEGAKACVEAGCLQSVERALMLHVLPLQQFPTGTVIVSSAGISAPSADFFDVTFYGKSCHGSSPWQGVDALLLGAKSVTALETLSSREFSPSTSATLTIGQFHAGEADNVIAEKAVLSGTLRTMSKEVREAVKRRTEEILKATAKAFRGKVRIRYKSGCPALENDEKMSDFLRESCVKVLGDERVYLSSEFPKGGVSGSEDFAYIAEKVPSVMVGICAGDHRTVGQPLHSPKVCFDETVMPYGAAVFAAAAFGYSDFFQAAKSR